VAARKALSCVYRTGQRFGAAHVIDVLRGGEGEKIRQFGHDRVSTYGIGADLDAKTWRGVFRQLVAMGLLAVDAEGYGGLRLTDASRAVLAGSQRVQMRRELIAKKSREREDRPRTGVSVLPEALPLFRALRDLRARLAKEQNVPAYVIFHDSTLREIAERRPDSLPELGRIGGIGGAKLARYGEEVLEVVREAG
jgi:ATP-dependent DNA helicase RecQ